MKERPGVAPKGFRAPARTDMSEADFPTERAPVLESKTAEKSLLDVVQARFDAGGGRESLTRMLYVGSIPKTATKHQVCDYHASFLTEIEADVSGLMLLLQTSFVNLIEATPDVINALLRHLQQETESPTACITNVRIVACSEDCPNPAFVSWSYRSISMPPEAGVDLDKEDIVAASFEVYFKLVKLGQQLSDADLPQADIPAALDNLRQRFPQFLPSNERVVALTLCDKVTSLAEFLDIFDAPLETTLESDRVWPAPPPQLYLLS